MTRLLKQRLIGAIVLISLGIIFIPMFLSGGGSLFSGDSQNNVPPKPMYEFKAPAGSIVKKQPPKPAVTDNNKSAPSANPPSPTKESNQTATNTATAGSAQSAATNDTTKPPSAAEIAALVAKTTQLAATPSSAPAPNPKTTTEGKSVQPPAQVATAPKPSPTQVKPASTQAAPPEAPPETQPQTPATTTMAKAAETSKASAKVPVEPKAAEAKKPIVSGWVVQLGSFAVQKNALKLRDKLRKNGYACFVESYHATGGKLIYRVRVGPELTRELAEKLKDKLKVATQLNGLVMSFPAK